MLPRPDFKDPVGILLGATKRICTKPPAIIHSVLEDYAKFCRAESRRLFKPVDSPEFDAFEFWLNGLDFSEARKQELRESWELWIERKDIRIASRVGSFVKDEMYESFKPLRWINARDDQAKVVLGPFFQKITDVFAQHPSVIKTEPVPERPKILMDLFGAYDVRISANDYTSFEAHFVTELMVIELEFYEYMFSHYPDFHDVMKFLDVICGGLNGISYNILKMKDWGSVFVRAKRCSGEMNTSLGNTFHNLMQINFQAHRKNATVVSVVEGDDSLAAYDPPERTPTAKDFEETGWHAKVVDFTTPGDASFCGNVYDCEDLIVVKDPIQVISTLGWVGKRYLGAKDSTLLSILKCKVLSMAHQYGRNPVIWALAGRLLYLLRDVNVKKSYINSLSAYEREQYRGHMLSPLIVSEPPIGTRLLVERLYGICLDDQYYLEEMFSSVNLAPVEIPDYLVPEAWSRCSRDYVFDNLIDDVTPHQGFEPLWHQELIRVWGEAGLSKDLERWIRQYRRNGGTFYTQ